jgi:hypothetical protein
MQAFYVINASVAALGYDTKYSLFLFMRCSPVVIGHEPEM